MVGEFDIAIVLTNEPPVMEQPAAVDNHDNFTTSLHRSSPPTLPAVDRTPATAGFSRDDPQGPLIPEGAAAHTTIVTDTATTQIFRTSVEHTVTTTQGKLGSKRK